MKKKAERSMIFGIVLVILSTVCLIYNVVAYGMLLNQQTISGAALGAFLAVGIDRVVGAIIESD